MAHADLQARLPAPDFATPLSTRAWGPHGESLHLEVDDASVHLGERAVPLDERLRPTLSWMLPERDALVLELRSVASALERVALSVCAPIDALPDAAGLRLPERPRGDAAAIDGESMWLLLARVRAIVETTGEAWVPPGDLALVGGQLPVRPVAAMGEVAKVAREHGLDVRREGDAIEIVPRRYRGGETRSLALHHGVALGAVRGTVFAFASWSVFALKTASFTQLWGFHVVVFVAIFLGTLLSALRRRPSGTPLAIEDDRITLPTERVLSRRKAAFVLPREAGIVALDHAGAVSPLGATDPPPTLVSELVTTAWHLDGVSAAELAFPPAWFARIDRAGVPRAGLRYAADAIWLDGIGISPRGVFEAETLTWHRCHAESLGGGRYGLAVVPERQTGRGLARDLVALINEIASPLRTSLFADRDGEAWTARTTRRRCVLAPRHGGPAVELEIDALRWADTRMAADAIHVVTQTGRAVEIVGKGAPDLAIACTSEAAARELAGLLQVWRDPTRPNPD